MGGFYGCGRDLLGEIVSMLVRMITNLGGSVLWTVRRASLVTIVKKSAAEDAECAECAETTR